MDLPGQASGRRIGYITSDLAVPFERELLTHALRTAKQLDLQMGAGCGGWLKKRGADAFAYDVMRRARLDGYVLCAHTVCVGMTTQQIAEFARSFAPAKVVIVGAEVPGFCCHTVSNKNGAAALTQHLVTAHGRHRFAVVRGPLGHSEADARLEGFKDALKSHQLDLPNDRIIVGNFDHESGTAAAKRLLTQFSGLRDLDAVVFANDYMAIAALDVFARARISIPGKVSIAGFDDIEMAHLARSPLTTVRQPLRGQVEGALKDLCGLLDGKEVPELVEHRTRLVLRRSCGCALVTRERISSAPPPAYPMSDPLQAIREYESTIAADLSASLRDSTLPRALSGAWAEELVQSFVLRIGGDDEGFIERIDASANALVQQDEPLTPLREAVLMLRRQLTALTGGTGPAADGLDDATAEALLTIGSVEALREAQRRRVLEAVAVELASASAAISAAGSLDELKQLAYDQFAKLNINTCVAVLEDKSADDEARVSVSYLSGKPAPAPSLGDASSLRLPAGAERQLLMVPMSAQGVARGFVLYDANPDTFLLTTRLTLALGAALHSAILKERLETAYEQIALLALKDPLTGLWNRRYLDQHLSRESRSAERSSDYLSACIVDLDGFKLVNDRHGHDAGDEVLVSVAGVLTRCAGPSDVVSRLGGDEFVILVGGADAQQAIELAQRIVVELDQTDAHGLVAASVGVATMTARVAASDQGRSLLLNADRALLEAKRRGKRQALHADQLLE